MPIATATAAEIKQIVLSTGPFGPGEVDHIIASIAADFTNYAHLRDATQELGAKTGLTPAAKVRLGVCYFLLGRYTQAIETLEKADGGAMARFYLGKAHFAKEDYEAALANYEAAAKGGYEKGPCTLGKAEALRYQGKLAESLKTLDGLSGAIEQSAEYLYQRGATIAAIGGKPLEVVALYERAVQADPRHPGALFGLALENDRRGNDEQALELYQRSADRVPTNLGSLINLGVMYEDRNHYERARQCYQRVLQVFPDHQRARLFLKDAMASTDQEFDEDAQRRQDRLTQVLSVPVTDFELSVRSRNCLQRMGIGTLGDLTRISEQSLLNSKNFGETSLVEIRDMMHSKGLEIGQFATDTPVIEYGPPSDQLSPDEQALLSRPVADLNLSVRARKAMVRLAVTSIADLVRRTGDELLECKNFGVTSLNEIREKLTAHGLKLRGD